MEQDLNKKNKDGEKEFDWYSYMIQLEHLTGNNVPDEYRADVISYLKLTKQIVQPLLECDIPEEFEAAPVYRP